MKGILSFMYECIVVGSGFAGAVIARELAETAGKKVLIIEKRSHVGGNMHDYYDGSGILVHRYGPHIFHTNSKHVFDYLSRFTEWHKYEHKVLGSIDGKLLPIPFNFNTLYAVFNNSLADRLKDILISKYGIDTKIPILKLMENNEPEIRKIADFIYSKIFLNYTIKQWGLKPEDIDPSVTARVPVYLSFDNRYFQDKYQGLPKDGYTVLFNNLLSHSNITVILNTDANELIMVDTKRNIVYFEGKPFEGLVIYTGAPDELLGYQYGVLPYRSLEFKFETHYVDVYQPSGTVNYPNENEYTRITEFKHLTGQQVKGVTTIVKEYPVPYEINHGKNSIPYYPIIKENNIKIYEEYKYAIQNIKNLYLLGRLAEYKYYNMDEIVEKALILYEELKKDSLI